MTNPISPTDPEFQKRSHPPHCELRTSELSQLTPICPKPASNRFAYIPLAIPISIVAACVFSHTQYLFLRLRQKRRGCPRPNPLLCSPSPAKEKAVSSPAQTHCSSSNSGFPYVFHRGKYPKQPGIDTAQDDTWLSGSLRGLELHCAFGAFPDANATFVFFW